MTNTLALRMRVYREANDLTEKEAAEIMGISQPYYNQIESGKRTPGDSTRRKIETVLSAWENEEDIKAIEEAKNNKKLVEEAKEIKEAKDTKESKEDTAKKEKLVSEQSSLHPNQAQESIQTGITKTKEFNPHASAKRSSFRTIAINPKTPR